MKAFQELGCLFWGYCPLRNLAKLTFTPFAPGVVGIASMNRNLIGHLYLASP
jgi:hypothetical protein